ncbi:MAG: hypothetical protein RJQ09_19205 [Cyclobacteriaceae bacterium]
MSCQNDLRENGQFNWRMEIRDGSVGYDFTRTYREVIINELITYTKSNGRKAEIRFTQIEGPG